MNIDNKISKNINKKDVEILSGITLFFTNSLISI